MSVVTKYYVGLPGNNRIIDAALSHVTILHVTRSGITYYLTGEEAPGNLQFVYSIASGGIWFQNNFIGPEIGRLNFSTLEKVSVKYKI